MYICNKICTRKHLHINDGLYSQAWNKTSTRVVYSGCFLLYSYDDVGSCVIDLVELEVSGLLNELYEYTIYILYIYI